MTHNDQKADTVKWGHCSASRNRLQRIIGILFLSLLCCVSASVRDTRAENSIMTDTRLQHSIKLMDSYARRTGLTSSEPQKRYLWTDAFAVCNYLGLARATGDEAYMRMAVKLVDQVHHTLGRHRDDDPRSGWISGLAEQEGQRHPTRGGLRIGKALPERGPDEPLDERLEWERDGQYFHYLTKWMHALDQVSRASGQARYNSWARELAATAFATFSYPTSGDEHRRMAWKMSIDLTRPLVPQMGKHDPLEGFITSLQLANTAVALSSVTSGPALQGEIAGYAEMVSEGEWHTEDPLGLGGLLVDAYRLQQLQQQGAEPQPQLLDVLLDTAITGLHFFTSSGELQQPPHYRLAFRELGLAIGLRAAEHMQQALIDNGNNTVGNPRLRSQLLTLLQYTHLREHIENFWLYPEHQQSDSWTEHRDINEVMLATCLAPEGMLELLVPARHENPAEQPKSPEFLDAE